MPGDQGEHTNRKKERKKFQFYEYQMKKGKTIWSREKMYEVKC